MLALQPRTRKELAEGLRRRGIPDEVADRVLDRFSDVGLVDDAAFANAWVTSRHRGRGLASRLLRHALASYRAAGYAEASLDVDTNNPTGAFGVYERAGFVIEQRTATFQRVIPAYREWE